jgi:hypothetical protein
LAIARSVFFLFFSYQAPVHGPGPFLFRTNWQSCIFFLIKLGTNYTIHVASPNPNLHGTVNMGGEELDNSVPHISIDRRYLMWRDSCARVQEHDGRQGPRPILSVSTHFGRSKGWQKRRERCNAHPFLGCTYEMCIAFSN